MTTARPEWAKRTFTMLNRHWDDADELAAETEQFCARARAGHAFSATDTFAASSDDGHVLAVRPCLLRPK